jgi:hypothetical protein
VLDNGNLLAHFGYQSDEALSLSIPVGSKNKLSPGKQDVGQPTTFLKGRFSNVFTVIVPVTTAEVRATTTSDYMRWTLGDSYADATTQTTRCASQEITCEDKENSDNLAELDNLAALQRHNIRLLSKRIMKLRRGGIYDSRAKSYATQAQDLYTRQWTTIWSSFSRVTKLCTGCGAIDKTSNVVEVTNRSKKFLRLSKLAGATLKKARGGRLTSTDAGLLNTATALHNRILAVSKELPTFESQCD